MDDPSASPFAMAAWRAAATAAHACGSPMAIGLAYHGVTQERLDGLENLFGKHIDAQTFQRHMEIVGRHFRVVQLADIVECLRTGRRFPRRAVFLTFDDGYAGNYEVAFPILRKMGFPATFFVPSAFIGTDRMLPLDVLDSAIHATSRRSVPADPAGTASDLPLDDPSCRRGAAVELRQRLKSLPPPRDQEFLLRILNVLGYTDAGHVPPLGRHTRLMNWEQVSDLARHGMDIGSHTHNHRILGVISRPDAYGELVQSKETLELHTGSECRLFCYPNGQYPQDGNEGTDRLVREAGYLGAVYMYGGINTRKTDPYRIARYSVGLHTPLPTLARYLASPRPRLGYLLGRP